MPATDGRLKKVQDWFRRLEHDTDDKILCKV